MFTAPSGTLFLGKKMVSVAECNSTNTLAADFLAAGTASDGMVVITDNQRQGRGQRGNAWHASAGLNLTLSVILQPLYLKVVDQFYLNMAVSLAVRDYLSRKVTEVSVKWPNDVMVEQRKIGGILIENQLAGPVVRHSVVGIGLNINQTDFDGLPATSLRLKTGHEFSLQEAFETLLQCLEVRYQVLQRKGYDELAADYTRKLYWQGQAHSFRAGEETFEGVIAGVDHAGRLMIESNGEVRYFFTKEVRYLS